MNIKLYIVKTKRESKTSPEQNAINFSSKVLSPAEKSILKKGPSFVPIPADINWCNLWQDFDSFVNKFRYHALKTKKSCRRQSNQYSFISRNFSAW